MNFAGVASDGCVLPGLRNLKCATVMPTSAPRKRFERPGIGQLSLVEHSLCPLDARRGLVDNLVHDARYQFTDARRRRRTARARVFCPLGLSANDELYLWGLLALTFAQRDHGGELLATPHWCLRRLELIDQHARRGGRQYTQFATALRRLSAVTYLNDSFYDPVRCEHRRVSFGFLSYSLPVDPDSGRAWRIGWDPVFLNLVEPVAGQFRFDLRIYRELDPASRRLFLFASKVFPRRSELPPMELRHLAVDVLGFAPTLETRDLKAKLRRCLARLTDLAVISESEIVKVAVGNYRVRVARGTYFDRQRTGTCKPTFEESPLWESLLGLGFEPNAAARLLKRYPHRLLGEWIDITQAARERFGTGFFRKSPMAYLVDSVSKAARGTRTPPDWWRELARQESTREANAQGVDVLARIRSELFGDAQQAEQREADSGAGPMHIATILQSS